MLEESEVNNMRIQLLYATLTRLKQYEEFLGIDRIYQYLCESEVECDIEQLFYDLDIEKELKKIDLSCAVFGFSIYIDSAQFIIKACEYIKANKPDAICFLGSQYATTAYSLLLNDYSCIDAIVLGHGEKVILDMIKSLQKGTPLDSIVRKSKYIAAKYSLEDKNIAQININEASNPSRRFYRKNRQLIASLVTKQGCSGVCTFCSCYDKFSCKSPDKIFDEIVAIYNKFRIRCFNFVDSTMTDMGSEGKQNLRRLCEKLKDFPIKFSFRCFLRADSLKNNAADIELLKLMRDVGFSNIFVGIESGNDKDLNVYGKGVRASDNQECLSLMHWLGLDVKFGFIMLNPYSDMATLEQNFDFLVRNKSWDSSCYTNCIEVYYGTPIYRSLQRRGLISEDYSYINNIYGYKVMDSFGEEVFRFIKSYIFTSDLKNANKYQNFNYLLSYISPIIGEGAKKFICVNKEFEERLAAINKDYFSVIYKEHNIDKAKAKLNGYIEKIKRIDEEIIQYNTLLIKEFVMMNKQ